MTRPQLKLASKRKPVTLEQIKRAVSLYRSEYAPRAVRRANARKWLSAVASLGDKWLIAQPQRRTK
jgi:hypothetical protein